MLIPTNRGRLGYNHREVSAAAAIDTGDDSLVQQAFRDEVDINTIVRRYGITRDLPFGPSGAMYGDFTGIEDFESAVALVDRARRGFESLPAEIREKFHNNPGELARFAASVSEDEFLAATNVAPPPEPPAPSGSNEPA